MIYIKKSLRQNIYDYAKLELVYNPRLWKRSGTIVLSIGRIIADSIQWVWVALTMFSTKAATVSKITNTWKAKFGWGSFQMMSIDNANDNVRTKKTKQLVSLMCIGQKSWNATYTGSKIFPNILSIKQIKMLLEPSMWTFHGNEN